MRFLLTLSLALCLTVAEAGSVRMLLQRSPLAGSQYYAVGAQWQQLQVGDQLDLVREPDNRHDHYAVRVEWRGHQLGYVPRADNRSVAAALDAGERLYARIAELNRHPDPWRRVLLEVYIEL